MCNRWCLNRLPMQVTCQLYEPEPMCEANCMPRTTARARGFSDESRGCSSYRTSRSHPHRRPCCPWKAQKARWKKDWSSWTMSSPLTPIPAYITVWDGSWLMTVRSTCVDSNKVLMFTWASAIRHLKSNQSTLKKKAHSKYSYVKMYVRRRNRIKSKDRARQRATKATCVLKEIQ